MRALLRLLFYYKPDMIKIALIGPESTGKSSLSRLLSEHYNSPFVPEYAREYLEQKGSEYTYEDVVSIAKKQIEDELFYEQSDKQTSDYVFFDTELIITKVWFLYCYEEVPSIVTEQMDKGFFDLYLLCAPDLPWEPDPLREHGDDREFFYDWYKKEIEIPRYRAGSTENLTITTRKR